MAIDITISTAANLAVAQPFSLGITAVAMANSIGLLMENAVIAEKGAQAIQNAGVAQCCALMIAAGAAKVK